MHFQGLKKIHFFGLYAKLVVEADCMVVQVG